MTATAAAGLALLSAVLHAGWNLFAKTSRDRLAAMWAVYAFGGAVLLPWLVIAGLPPRPAWPYLAASTVVQVGYAFTLATAYNRADFSAVYPVARGMAPLLTAVGGLVLLDDALTTPALIGIVLVSLALGWIALGRGRVTGLEWAVATGAIITTYTLIDAAGVRAADESVRYVGALYVTTALLLGAVIAVRPGRSRIRIALRTETARLVGAGAMSAGAYLLVLTAARFAPIGVVSALRETSVVWGALGGWLILSENLGRERFAAAMVVVVGAVMLVAV